MSRSLINHLFVAFLLVASLGCGQAYAHNSAVPKHGGIVKITGEMSFELVALENSADVYLMYDSEALDTAKMTGSLKITIAGESKTVELKPAGGNRFTAADVTIPKGSKVLVMVTEADGYSKSGASFTIE